MWLLAGTGFQVPTFSRARFQVPNFSRADFLAFFAQPSLACRPGLKAPLARTGIRRRHSEAMAAEEDFYDLDVDAEEAVTEGISPWAVGVSSRILCERLSDPESTSGDGALPVYLAWPLPCVGDLRTSVLWKAIEQYHHCIPKDFLVQWVDNMKSYVYHASRDGHLALARGCSGTVMWRHCNDALL